MRGWWIGALAMAMVSGGGEVVLIFGTVCSRIEFGDDGSFNLSVFC